MNEISPLQDFAAMAGGIGFWLFLSLGQVRWIMPKMERKPVMLQFFVLLVCFILATTVWPIAGVWLYQIVTEHYAELRL